MTKIGYRPEIDGLRTVAILSVLFYHAGFSLNGGELLSGGFLGVDVFFVISGYLISSLILKGLADRSFSFWDFYERRARRILPILFTVMLASLPFIWLFMLPSDTTECTNSILYALLFSSNFWFWLQDPYWATASNLKPFLHTWSLAVEEQFYIVMPFFLILVHRYAIKALFPLLAILSVGSLVFAQWASARHPEFAFYMLPTRMWELLVGSMLAVYEQKKGGRPVGRIGKFLPSIGLILILVSLFCFSKDVQHPSFLTLIPIMGSALILLFARSGEPVTALLSSKPFVGIGLISYGLYIWHFPLFAFSRIIFGNLTNSQALGVCCLSLLVSALTYFLIEKPCRQKKVPFRKVAVFLSIALVVLFSFCWGARADGYKGRFPSFFNVPQKPEHMDNQVWLYTTKPRKGRIILVGDSHMEAIAPVLRDMALDKGYDFAVSNIAGCELILGVNRVNKKTFKQTHCSPKLNQERFDFIKKAKPSIVILGGRLPLMLEEDRFNNKEGAYEGEMTEFLQNETNSLKAINERKNFTGAMYTATVKRIVEAGHKVILIYPIPEVGWHVPQTLMTRIHRDYIHASEIAEKQPVTTSYAVFQERTRSAYDVLNGIKFPNVYRIFPETLFCNLKKDGRCITHDAHNVYYRDDDHLSEYGAKMLSEKIFKEVLSKEK
ncbi:MAG: acyltransferase family protein [Bdellovibrionales bacterium]